MKKLIFLIVFYLGSKATIAQNKFFIQLQSSPKISINLNTGIIPIGNYNTGSNVPDGRSALAFGLRDYSIAAGYRLSKKSSISLGIGIFAINQIFRPDKNQFAEEHKNIHKYLNFLIIPISFEHKLYSFKKLTIYGGVHLSFIGDVFSHKNNNKRDGYLELRNGKEDTNFTWEYKGHYLNMHTFNFLYGFSVKSEYHINKKLSFYASAQMMQGFRPLITSFVSFADSIGLYSPSISSTNGQSIMMNLGFRYNF